MRYKFLKFTFYKEALFVISLVTARYDRFGINCALKCRRTRGKVNMWS